MPPKKSGLIGKEVEIFFKYEKKTEGPFQVLGFEPPFLKARHVELDRTVWFNTQDITAMKEVVSAKQ